jgi:spermidine synthase
LRNWSPVVRVREDRTPRALDPASVDDLSFGHTVREARETRYHRLLVTEDGASRYLRFDSSFQSGMWLDDPFRTRFAYTDYLHLGLAYNPAATRVLVIGLGGAAVQKRLWRDFRDLQVTTVELDPDVVAVARRWFALPDDPRVRVEVGDGRRFLESHDDRWDVIMVDAFYADGVPFQLTTLEFVQRLQTRLRPGGVVATNTIGSISGSSSRLTRALVKTYGAVFPTVKLHPVYDGARDRRPDDIRNIVLVGTERVAPPRSRLLQTWGEVRATRAPSAPDLTAAVRDRWEGPLPLAGVPLLTDSYAPTDSLLLE